MLRALELPAASRVDVEARTHYSHLTNPILVLEPVQRNPGFCGPWRRLSKPMACSSRRHKHSLFTHVKNMKPFVHIWIHWNPLFTFDMLHLNIVGYVSEWSKMNIWSRYGLLGHIVASFRVSKCYFTSGPFGAGPWSRQRHAVAGRHSQRGQMFLKRSHFGSPGWPRLASE